MHSAFDTLQLELERLRLLRESLELAGVLEEDAHKFDALTNKISEHEHALQIIVRESQREQHVTDAFNNIPAHQH